MIDELKNFAAHVVANVIRKNFWTSPMIDELKNFAAHVVVNVIRKNFFDVAND